MAEKFLLEIVTPKRLLFSEEVETVTVPGVDGEFGVLMEHTPLITPLKPGELSYVSEGGEVTSLAISTGYAEVLPDKTTILVSSAFTADEIDVSVAAEELSSAEEALSSAEKDSVEATRLENAVDLAKAKIAVTEKVKH